MVAENLLAPSQRGARTTPYKATTPYFFAEEEDLSSDKGGFFKSPTASLAIAGASAGSYFGPAGAFAGAAIGAVGGAFMGSKGKRARGDAYRKSVHASLKAGRDIYGAFGNVKEGVEKTYQKNLAQRKAQFAGSGGRLEGASWQAQVGAEITAREKAEGDLGAEYDKFKKSSVGKTLLATYGRLATGGTRVEEYGGTSIYSRSDFKKIKRFQSTDSREVQSGEDYNRSEDDPFYSKYREYQSKYSATFEEYQTLQFGTAEDRFSVRENLSQRLEQANEWWEPFEAEQAIERESRTKVSNYDRGD